MIDDLSPEGVAQAKRETMLGLSPQEFALWLHNPITAGFFQFMDDQIASWREMAADLVEAGAFTVGARSQDQNPDVVRGRIVALKELRQITVQTIQGAYGQEPPDETQAEQA
jgi:hypothetical protein